MMTELDLAEAKERALLAKLDEVYSQRNALACILALAVEGIRNNSGGLSPYRAGRGHDPSQEPEWQTTILIDLPGVESGQISFHVPQREADFFRGLGDYPGAWDGHTDAEKMERMRTCLRAQTRLMQDEGLLPPDDESGKEAGA